MRITALTRVASLHVHVWQQGGRNAAGGKMRGRGHDGGGGHALGREGSDHSDAVRRINEFFFSEMTRAERRSRAVSY